MVRVHVGNGPVDDHRQVHHVMRTVFPKQPPPHALQDAGKEQLYDGVTGKPLEALVFIAPVYHEVLKHFVEDKAYTRTTGKVTVKHRSPPDGRKRRGGLRFGEMERDVSLAQGGSAVLLDRLFEQCDAFQIPVCDFGSVSGVTVF